MLTQHTDKDVVERVVSIIFRRLFIFALGALTAVWLIGISPIGRDDSDPGKWGDRSGIKPRIDHLTGCQYLEATSGGITPRLDANGNHICAKGS